MEREGRAAAAFVLKSCSIVIVATRGVSLPTQSLLPNRTLHYLPVPEDRIVFGVVHQASPQYSKVENLVAGTAEVKLSWSAALRTPCHVDYGPLDIDVSAEGVHPE